MNKKALRAGVFIPPHHPVHENPTLAIHRDLELVEWCDHLGYQEAWIGEHHSAGYELVGSPEIFIAAAAERTKQIRLGTGVVSLPYHNPLMVADRMIQLDHQTRGRAMLGVGPGLLVSDAMMLKIPPDQQRDRMEEALDIILRLFDGETITHESEWISLKNARLHLLPYTHPRPHVAIASAVTPNGAYVAGRFGLGMLCVAASNVAGYDVLDVNWKVAENSAAQHGNTMDRKDLRLVIHMHLAETREQAIEDVRWGFPKWQEYTLGVNPRGRLGTGTLEEVLAKGMTVVGTPDDAVAFLNRYWDKTGGFGCLLLQATNWARFDATKRSYEMFIRYALPEFSGINRAREESYAWMRSNTEEFSGAVMAASRKATEKRFGGATPGASPAKPAAVASKSR